jgi:L-alanine-DL-glutamate epimerase-like enolase superfamily enzyme
VSFATVSALRSRVETHAYREPFGRYLEGFFGPPGLACSLLVEAELSEGRRGSGEATLLPSWSGESPAAAERLLDLLRPVVLDVDAGEAMEAARRALAANGYLLWGLEAALVEAQQPVPEPGSLPLRGLIGPFDPETSARLAAAQAAEGYERVKVKLSGVIAEDDARLRAVRDAAPGVTLIVDANEAIAPAFLPGYYVLFAETRVAGVEQPCPRGAVAERGLPPAGDWLWIADESIWGYEDALALRNGPWHVWTLHPGKSRGEAELRRVTEVAHEHGIATVVGSNLHFGCGVAALRRIAARLPSTPASELLGHDVPAPVVYEGWSDPVLEVRQGRLELRAAAEPPGVAA